MFEFEADHDRLSVQNIPHEVVESFTGHSDPIDSLTLLPWEEHCTECAMPMCYSTCQLYEARKDGKCRRFVGGITSVGRIENLQGHIARVSFKRWGQLMAYANLNAVPARSGKWLERIVYFIDAIVSRIPDRFISIRGRSGISTRLQRRIKQALARGTWLSRERQDRPDYLLLEIYNPNSTPVNITLTVSPTDPDKYNAGYQELLELDPGFQRYKIPVDKIAQRTDMTEKFGIALNPNIVAENDEGLTLYFGMMSFVWERLAESRSTASGKTEKPHIKVVVWDLDNTLWDGILIEDGIDNVKLKPGVVEVIKELDRRGIMNSVVSKNNPDDAIAALDKFGLTEYMLYPQIGWEQKGLYVRSLVRQFNVAQNTFAFVDDQPFERDEVRSLNPAIRTYDAADYNTIVELDEFNPPLSSESHLRRKFYTVAQMRDEAMSGFNGDYAAFLKECRIKLNIYAPAQQNLERILELVQRTNQLNFSGNRYTPDQIENILADSRYHAYCLDCEDKYGHYGTVGFAIVDNSICRLTDMMFSCRVQSKRVEHAFLAFLLKHYRDLGNSVFSAVYVKTDRNTKAGAVFDDMNFTVPKDSNNHVYTFDLTADIPDDEIISVFWNGDACQH